MLAISSIAPASVTAPFCRRARHLRADTALRYTVLLEHHAVVLTDDLVVPLILCLVVVCIFSNDLLRQTVGVSDTACPYMQFALSLRLQLLHLLNAVLVTNVTTLCYSMLCCYNTMRCMLADELVVPPMFGLAVFAAIICLSKRLVFDTLPAHAWD